MFVLYILYLYILNKFYLNIIFNGINRSEIFRNKLKYLLELYTANYETLKTYRSPK